METFCFPMFIRVLLVDDHELVRAGLRLRLTQEKDIEIVGEAGCAQKAYTLIGKVPVDVVVLDLHLPDAGGQALVREVRQKLPRAHILVLTGVTPASLRPILLAGADGIASKEDPASEVVRAIRLLVAGKNYLSPDAVTRVVQAMRDPTLSISQPSTLSDTEINVLRLFAEGLSYKEIADQLNLSVKSIESYRTRLTKKLDCESTAELVRYAVRKGIVAP